ncbi:hypothetical protein Tco_1167133 [Tanacetum coccineum]
MDNPNITMKEYIRIEEQKARRCGKVYNWETAMYSKIWDNEDVYDLGSFENEFPAIVFNESLTSEATLSCEPTVSSLNDNEINFRISFDESNDEDYTPTISCFIDLEFFKDFENEFPAIVYNDALKSKSDFLTEPSVRPQHIDEFNLKDETSLSECDEEEQNVLCLIDLFSFNVIYPDDSKSDEDNDDDKIDIEHYSRDLSVKPLPDVINTDDVIMEYLVKVSKKRVFWSLNEDILKIYYSEDQYAVSIKEDTAYPCLHSPKTTKERRSIRRIQRRPIHRIGNIVIKYSGRY